MTPNQVLRNERGILTLDFIFALMIGMGFTIVFFAMTLTLSLVEVTQYISFAVARTSWAAHETRSLQVDIGNKKYDELRQRPVFKTIFGQGWFRLPARPNFGDLYRGFNDEYDSNPGEDNATFIGARLRIEAKILELSIPMLGDTKTNPETGVANVQTFLGREVTTTECREQFNEARWTRIRALSPIYAGPYAGGVDPVQFVKIITDNGC